MTQRPSAVAGLSVGRVAAAGVLGLLAGCAASRSGLVAGSPATRPVETQTLADLQPPLALPSPQKPPAADPSLDALQDYARGHDALLSNQKQPAIDALTAATVADPASAVVWRDLGYAESGIDDAKAADAFRRATAYDPADADSRLQLARVLLTGKHTAEAVEQLRLARLSPAYTQSAGLAAVVDLLLGQALESTHYRTAALECYTNVIAVLDDRGFDLRGRPELAEVVARPAALMLRAADLALQVGDYDRAIGLYQRLRRQEPQAGPTIDLRLARAELAAGKTADATRRAVGVVDAAHGSALSLALFDELFAAHGGPAAALANVGPVAGDFDPSTVGLLRSHLLLAGNRADEAARVAEGIVRLDVPVVRQIVHAYLAADRRDDLVRTLIARTAAAPDHWPVIARGFAVLTQVAQADPLTGDDVAVIDVPPAQHAARAFVVGQLYLAAGRQASADRMAAVAATDPEFKRIDATTVIDPASASEPIEISSSPELAVLIDDYRDDPDLLSGGIADVLRSGQKRLVEEAFVQALARRPGDAVLGVTNAQVLVADDQRVDAVASLDHAAAAARFAGELYLIASQYSGMGEDKLAEQTLRKALTLNATFPAVCNDLGFLLTDAGRDLPLAQDLLNRAVHAEPDNAAYLDSLGWLLYKRGRFADAAGCLDKAVAASKPTDPVVLDHAGDASYRADQKQAATDRWTAAVDAIKQRGTADPQLRLRIERKLQQAQNHTAVGVAAVAKQ